jgi:hypothetical protein
MTAAVQRAERALAQIIEPRTEIALDASLGEIQAAQPGAERDDWVRFVAVQTIEYYERLTVALTRRTILREP